MEDVGIILLVDFGKLAHNPVNLLGLSREFEPAEEQSKRLVEVQVLEVQHQAERLQHALVVVFRAAEVLTQGLFAYSV